MAEAKTSKALSKMTVENVSALLNELKLSQHVKSFADNDVDGPLLASMSGAAMGDLGLNTFQQTKLLKRVDELKAASGQSCC